MRYIIGAVIVLAGFFVLAFTLTFAQHWWAVHTGTTYLLCKGSPCPNQIYYNFWSGFGSDLGEATLVSAVVIGVYQMVRKVNCHTKGCWRIGHHPLEGTPYTLCRTHHPDVPTAGASHAHILGKHQEHQTAKAVAPAPAKRAAKKAT